VEQVRVEDGQRFIYILLYMKAQQSAQALKTLKGLVVAVPSFLNQ